MTLDQIVQQYGQIFQGVTVCCAVLFAVLRFLSQRKVKQLEHELEARDANIRTLETKCIMLRDEVESLRDEVDSLGDEIDNLRDQLFG